MVDIEKLKPIGRTLLVRKCTWGEKRGNQHWVGTIAVPDFVAENTGWAEIIAVGDSCKLFDASMIGEVTHLPPWKPNHMRRVLNDDEYFLVKEELFDLPPEDGGADPYIYIAG